GWTVEENVEFQNKSLIFNFNRNRSSIILKNESLGKMRKGKMVRKFTFAILPSFCPYCGEKLSDDTE
ncbi:MAG: hypothetical protein LBH60_01040, partial [Prevotellaceae bacterium]|nr:hypothetical protein [Prevotellaceae bacterium]